MHERCQTTSLNSSLRRSCVLGDDVHFKEASRALMETPPPEQEPGKCCKKSVYACLPLKCHASSVYLYRDHSVRACVCARASTAVMTAN